MMLHARVIARSGYAAFGPGRISILKTYVYGGYKSEIRASDRYGQTDGHRLISRGLAQAVDELSILLIRYRAGVDEDSPQ